MTPKKPTATLADLSSQLTAAVENAAQSIVSIHARRRIPSSGVVWREGVIVSASHTVRRDDEIRITLPNGDSTTARVVGRDPSTDLIALRLADGSAKSATVKTDADAESAKIGAFVLAAGRPGHAVTASFGIIGAIGEGWRTAYGRRIERVLRLNLAIYDGFSGGPLVDPAGAVIGINTSGLGRGAPMTLPASVVDSVVDELLERGHIRRGFVGVALHPVELGAALADRMKLEHSTGLVVISVADASPASSAGLMIGDIIVKASGQPLRNHSDFIDALWTVAQGATFELEVLRGGERKTLSVTPADREAAA